MPSDQKLEYVVGEEKRLQDVLTREDVEPLFNAALQSGAISAQVFDDEGSILWQKSKDESSASREGYSSRLTLEGEPVGALQLSSSNSEQSERLSAIAVFLGHALNSLIASNLKRMLTTEMHTQVVNLSYEELLETNQQLQQSEQNYRELAESLDKRVQERTKELKTAYARLIQQEKMASIGQLAAGVAHEINNPLGFIQSNMSTLKKYVRRIIEMNDFYQDSIAANLSCSELTETCQEQRKRLKLDFVCDDMEDIFEESFNGVERVQKIVSDLKGFSHIDAIGSQAIDLHEEIERTLNVLSHEVPDGAQIQKVFDNLPLFHGHGGNLAQLFLNLIRNALQARSDGLVVRIETEFTDGQYQFLVADNGPGIAADVGDKIFEPFFTTRDVGHGTGLGLSVAYDIVRDLNGEISYHNRDEGGVAFCVCFPRSASDE